MDHPYHGTAEEKLAYETLFGKRPDPIAIFDYEPEKDEAASEAAGFPIYRDVLYVREHNPDCPDSISVNVADALKRKNEPIDYRKKYASDYATFCATKEFTHHFLHLIPQIKKSAIASFMEAGIRTIEELAAYDKPLPEHLQPHQAFARRFLAVVNGAKPRLRLQDGQLVPVEIAA